MSSSAAAAVTAESQPADSARFVLIPVDGGPYDARVFNWYLDNARQPRDNVMFVHVLQHSHGCSIPDEEKLAKKVRDAVFERAREVHLSNYRFTELVGTDVKVCLVNYVNNHQVDEVLMSARGRSYRPGQRPAGVGRVAEFLLKHVSVPVQLVSPG